jgi:hypothetical protein
METQPVIETTYIFKNLEDRQNPKINAVPFNSSCTLFSLLFARVYLAVQALL